MNRKSIINKTLIRSSEPGEKVYELRDSKLTGFILRVYPSGRKTYVCQYARGRRISIGKVAVLTPAQARDRAKEILADVTKGVDPRVTKLGKKAHSLESYILKVYASWTRVHHRDGAATIARIKTNFFSALGKYKLRDVTPWNLEKWRSQRLKAGIQPATINRDISDLKAAFNRAVDWGLIRDNPLTSVKPIKLDRTPKVRYLDDQE
ncbi:MAG TPA: DUF4102 domain-containing protein, partial [Actinobacteria bacterium]|nr:DUF4102 domain-containing protein [Actinomycetota bacterium]